MDDYTLWQIEQIIEGLVGASAIFATLGILMYVALCIAVAACAIHERPALDEVGFSLHWYARPKHGCAHAKIAVGKRSE